MATYLNFKERVEAEIERCHAVPTDSSLLAQTVAAARSDALQWVLSILPSDALSPDRERVAPALARLKAWVDESAHLPDSLDACLGPETAHLTYGDMRAILALTAADPIPIERDPIEKGLADCGEGIPYEDHSPSETASMAAYAVLRCCGLIGAGDQRVPQRIGRTVAEMSRPDDRTMAARWADSDVPPLISAAPVLSGRGETPK